MSELRCGEQCQCPPCQVFFSEKKLIAIAAWCEDNFVDDGAEGESVHKLVHGVRRLIAEKASLAPDAAAWRAVKATHARGVATVREEFERWELCRHDILKRDCETCR